MKSLKSKFILSITSLIVLVIIFTSAILVNQKRLELQEDIYLNARSFSELASFKIIELVDTNLKQNNFLFFLRDLNGILKNNPDISNIVVYDFSGKTVFDFLTENQKQYTGSNRQITKDSKLKQIKSAVPSVLTTSNQVFYLEKVKPGEYDVILENGQRMTHSSSIKNFRNIQSITYPVSSKYAIEYQVSYNNLTTRLTSSAYQILLIGLISILASIIIGYVLSIIVTTPIRKLTEIVKQIAQGDFSKRAIIKSDDEVGLLADSVNHMAEDLEKSTEARIYQEKTKKELEIAAKIQRELLPSVLPKIKGLDLAAEVIPATEIGGDVYDVLLDKSNVPFFYVGDVTGHGVPAGLISSVTNAIITSTVDLADPLEIVVNLNKVLKDKSAGNLFLTLLFARFHNGHIDYISAGHEKVIFFSAKQNKTYFLEPGGIALGLFADVSDKLKLDSIKFNTGDAFIIYTDGIPEAWQTDTLAYGDEKLLQVADSAIKNSTNAEETKKIILDDVNKFMGDYPQKDDITILIIRKT